MATTAVIVAGALALFFVALLARALLGPPLLPALPAAESADKAAPGSVKVSVVVAVRNEMDRTLDDSLAGLLAQDHPALEIVAVDDHSDDGSRAVLDRMASTRERLRVVGAAPRVRGKRAALAQAAAAANGSWLLFTDADVRLSPDAVSRALAYAVRGGLDALSLLPRTLAISLWEQIAISATGWLVYAGHQLQRCNRDDAPVGLAAAGPFLLVRRAAYEAIGGYGAMRQNVLVDVALARQLRGAGFRYRYLASNGAVEARMYRSLAEIWRGFGKNAFLALGGRVDVALGAAAACAAAVALPPILAVVLFATGHAVGGALASVACAASTSVQRRGAAFLGTRPRLIAALLSPLGAVLWLAIVGHSAYRTSVRTAVVWKGRELPVIEPQKEEVA